MNSQQNVKRKTITDIVQKKKLGQKVSVLTCYDYTMSRLLDSTEIDILLVGDSLSNVFCGNETTLPITLDEMIYHTKAVMKGSKQALVVVDMPFGSYQINESQAIESAIRVMKETGAMAIKIEGGAMYAPLTEKLVKIGIPVMGHLGLLPQSVHQIGGHKLQAKSEKSQNLILEDAKALENAGCFSIVLEKIPLNVSKLISETLLIPTIGIGAGVHCDGQVLVINDLLGLNPNLKLKFVREYANIGNTIKSAVKSYIEDVNNSQFPNKEESFS